MISKMTIVGLVLSAVLAANTSECDTQVGSGTVQDKRITHTKVGIDKHELCLGETRRSCRWAMITGRADRTDYRNCSVGEQYPKCARPTFGRR